MLNLLPSTGRISPVRKKGLALFALLVLLTPFLCCCGEVDDGRPKPIDTAKEFISEALNGKTDEAYKLLSKKQRMLTPLDTFKDITKERATGRTLGESGLNLEAQNQVVDGNKAFIYGESEFNGKRTPFILPLVFEDGKWLLDHPSIQLENASEKGFYFNLNLVNDAKNYFDKLLDGDAKYLWENTSSKIKNGISFEDFMAMTVATQTGKKPREEGFVITIKQAYSNEQGEGFATGVLTMTGSQSQIALSERFIFEEGKWVADFIKLETEIGK